MKFTDLEWQKIYDTYDNNEELIVTACNSYGQEFSLEGKIGLFFGSEVPEFRDVAEEVFVGVLDDSIILECGNEKPSKGSLRTKYCAQMFSSTENKNINPLEIFFIKNISVKNSKETIYENQDYEVYKKAGKKRYNEHFDYLANPELRLLKDSLAPAGLSTKGYNFMQLIGKPIDAQFNNTGILYFVDYIDLNLNINFSYIDFDTLKRKELPPYFDIALNEDGIITYTSSEKSHELQ